MTEESLKKAALNSPKKQNTLFDIPPTPILVPKDNMARFIKRRITKLYTECHRVENPNYYLEECKSPSKTITKSKSNAQFTLSNFPGRYKTKEYIKSHMQIQKRRSFRMPTLKEDLRLLRITTREHRDIQNWVSASFHRGILKEPNFPSFAKEVRFS